MPDIYGGGTKEEPGGCLRVLSYTPSRRRTEPLADAQSAHLLFQTMKKLHGGERPQAFAPAPLFYRAKREQPATKRQKEYLQDLIKCHRINITVCSWMP